MRATAEHIDTLVPDVPGLDRWLRHFLFLHWVLGENKATASFIAGPCSVAPLPLSTMGELEADWHTQEGAPE